ncbi:protein-tyrosine phosphatase-like protein [Pilobolus umbonatus]|nr:protein-tyrosine phosphatase-like protein [Pilobolus umbonatus]
MSTELESLYAHESHLYDTLECGPDGKPGGIIIRSVGQEVYPGIWLGGYKALETRSFLEKNKIRSILTLGHFKFCYATEFNHKIIPVTDNPEANIIKYFPEAIEFIKESISRNENILVHCLAGVSRSPTIVTAFLMATQHLRYKAALAIIKQTRPFVNPNPGFIEQLRLFQQMNYQFDRHNPLYIDYLKNHPKDAGHLGHEEYENS